MCPTIECMTYLALLFSDFGKHLVLKRETVRDTRIGLLFYSANVISSLE